MVVTAKCTRRTGSKDSLTCEVFDGKSGKGCLVTLTHVEGGELGNTLRVDVHRCDKGVVVPAAGFD